MEVDPVEERAGDAVSVTGYVTRLARALPLRMAPVAAGAPPRCLSAISDFGPKNRGIPVIPRFSTAWATIFGSGGLTSD